MKYIVIGLLIIMNAIFSRVCGWWEGVLDHHFYLSETIAGFKKHRVYMVVRSCFWIPAAGIIVLLFKDEDPKDILITLSSAFFCILGHFRCIQVGYYHITRNDLDHQTSKDRFRQNNDGRSGSWWDKYLGREYVWREFWFWAGTTVELIWLIYRMFFM